MEKLEFNEIKYGKEWIINKTDIPKLKIILKLIGKDKTVLDIGCNDGTISKLISSNKNKVYGVDISSKAVALAREKGIEAYQLDVEKSNLEQFPDGSFDLVYSSEVIEHITDTDHFLQKIHRILKPGGISYYYS